MRSRSLVAALTLGALVGGGASEPVAGRCSYIARYPLAIGNNAYLLATATAGSVTALVDSPYVFRPSPVAAQVMRVEDVSGSQSAGIRDGLRRSGGMAVFVRYHIGMSCSPVPAVDGAFDSVGVSGLFVGRPRPDSAWVDGNPTFDIFRAAHYPLPQRFLGPSGHLVIGAASTGESMTAVELFSMYRALWLHAVGPNDTTVEQRIRRWLAGDPSLARKAPARQVLEDMITTVSDALVRAHPIPLGGTFAITLSVAGVDSVRLYGQTYGRARQWTGELVSDRITGLPVAFRPKDFAIDFQFSSALDSLGNPALPPSICSLMLIVGSLPIVLDTDSSWTARVMPTMGLECAPAGSPLAALARPRALPPAAHVSVPLRIQLHADGRVTLEADPVSWDSTRLTLRGERVNTRTYGPWFD